jgi:hypothetical protein
MPINDMDSRDLTCLLVGQRKIPARKFAVLDDTSMTKSQQSHVRLICDQAVDDATPPTLPRNQLATEILENLARFPHCILLTRVGQFYEVIASLVCVQCPVLKHGSVVL